MLKWLAAAAVLAVTPALAQTYPAKVVRVVVPFAPGGTADLLGRVAADQLSQALGGQFIVDNRAGAGSALGSDIVAQSPPDGYTLVISNAASHGVAPGIQKKIPYDADRDFAHVALIGVIPQFLVVTPGFPVKTLQELVAAAKAEPGKINYGTAGIGSIGHLAGEFLKFSAGIDIVHVPYRGTAPATQDLLAGRIQMQFQNAPEAAPHIRANTVRLIAVTAEHRLAAYPDTPTIKESGYPEFVTLTWYGISGPKGMPEPIVQRLNAALNERMARPEVKAKMVELGVTPESLSPAQYASFVRAEVAKFGAIVRRANIQEE